MKQLPTRRLLIGAIILAVAGAAAGTAYAASGGGGTQTTPKGWNYEIKDGKRVPKADRKTNADGSWREETKQGSCTTVKESSAQGEVKTTRKCD